MDIKQKLLKKCEICKVEATCLCLQCYSYLCDLCFKYVHEKESNKNHKREKIDSYIQIDTKCPDHSTIPINLFCVEEKGN